MTRYLNPIEREGNRRHHSVVPHILADDGTHALCVYRPGVKSWPRVFDGEWEAGDNPSDEYICSRCRLAVLKSKNTTAKPIKKTAREKALEKENAKLRAWNEKARKFMNEMLS